MTHPNAALPLHHALRGSGAPLLLLNGIGLDLDTWGPFAERLARERRLILADLRGTGGSPPADAPCTTAALAADVLALLDHLELEAVDVLGLSLGGLVAQELTLLAPGRVRALVLAATAARLPGRSRRVLDAWRRLLLTAADRDALLREQVAWVLGSAALEDDATTEAVVAAMASGAAPSPRGFSAQADACLAHDTRERGGRVRAPALVLGGEEDALVPPSATRALASLLPQARLELLPGGHAFLLESAAGAAEAVLRFLSEVDGRALAPVAAGARVPARSR